MLNRFISSKYTTTGNNFYARRFKPEVKLRWSAGCGRNIVDCFGDQGRCIAALYNGGLVAFDMASGTRLWDTGRMPEHSIGSGCVLTDTGYIFCCHSPRGKPIGTIAFNAVDGTQCDFWMEFYIPVGCCNDQLVLGRRTDLPQLSVSIDGKFTLKEFPFPNSVILTFGTQLRHMWIAQQPREFGDPLVTYAGDLDTGTIRWRNIGVSPRLAEGNYVLARGPSSQDLIRLIRAEDGATLWEIPAIIKSGICLIAEENKVIVHGPGISCFDLRNGEQIWRVDLKGDLAWGLVATVGIV